MVAALHTVTRTHAEMPSHDCDAPCVVYLPDNTEEDEFGIDYGWRDSHTPMVDVYANDNKGGHHTDGADRYVAAVNACVGNPNYSGTTPKETRRMFAQCLADYNDTKGQR